MAAKLLQNHRFQTLAMSKSVEAILVLAFEKFCDDESTLVSNGKLISNRMYESLIRNLKSKITSAQHKATVVIYFICSFLIKFP